jgi:predicted O-methyltransferase YrrM
MNLRHRLGPCAYAALHAHTMVQELMLSRSERSIAQSDAVRLRVRFPFLQAYDQLASEYRGRLQRAYQDYTSRISPDPIAISLELATFLAVICARCRPRNILDLGSGFSSFVFRTYAEELQPQTLVCSVDHSSIWLNTTRGFLHERGLDCRGLLTWEAFVAVTERPRFDLILQDMSDLETRRRQLDTIIEACNPTGMIVIDDMHVPAYRRAILDDLDRHRLSHYSLRDFTRKRLRYAYLATLPTRSLQTIADDGGS